MILVHSEGMYTYLKQNQFYESPWLAGLWWRDRWEEGWGTTGQMDQAGQDPPWNLDPTDWKKRNVHQSSLLYHKYTHTLLYMYNCLAIIIEKGIIIVIIFRNNGKRTEFIRNQCSTVYLLGICLRLGGGKCRSRWRRGCGSTSGGWESPRVDQWYWLGGLLWCRHLSLLRGYGSWPPSRPPGVTDGSTGDVIVGGKGLGFFSLVTGSPRISQC